MTSGPLQTKDVTSIAEDDDGLKTVFNEETGTNGIVEGWITPVKVLQRGPYSCVSAVVIKFKSGLGAVRIFVNDNGLHRDIAAYETKSDAEDKVTMIFLEPNYYCWLMGYAKVRFIMSPVSKQVLSD
ncbi:hypothetical protein I7I51_04998 [Histoplasma capsulatum]|uniref:Uncharacterized protein n=1 Tax=Ajellomyces capsulatus TaxID=5037 RepID=A0A8A1M2H2_AJECA|nr:predicted protein [Histoplasma mississippiense (nom. inval.)]EDN09609.1 predicted protein [Histoplasma mississippiense (nom. inval.)]QSS60201.1 hypothetical protein I7I51_04998 [Histoplasma capsulatum]